MSLPVELVDRVADSYARARGTDFAALFYERFLASDEEVRRHFAKTDFARQRELFLHGLFALLDYARGGPVGGLAVRRLAEMHGSRGMNISRRLYELWADHLVAALAERDPAWEDTLEADWREVLAPGIEALLAG